MFNCLWRAWCICLYLLLALGFIIVVLYVVFVYVDDLVCIAVSCLLYCWFAAFVVLGVCVCVAGFAVCLLSRLLVWVCIWLGFGGLVVVERCCCGGFGYLVCGGLLN